MARPTVHHLENSRSQRVLWLLEELGVDYDLKVYPRHRKTGRAPAELRAVHPLGKSPVVELDDGVVLAESGAILEELVDRFGEGRLRPAPGTDASRRCRFWLHYAEGSLMPVLLVKLIMDRLRNPPMPFFLKPLPRLIAGQVDAAFTDPEIVQHRRFIEEQIGAGPWLLGDELTIADIQMSFPLEALVARGDAVESPRIRAFVERVRSREAFQRALKRGGPYDLRF